MVAASVMVCGAHASVVRSLARLAGASGVAPFQCMVDDFVRSIGELGLKINSSKCAWMIDC